MKLDANDLKIIENLSSNSRTSARNLAQKIGISTVTVISKMKKMEKAGIIKKYSVVIDHEKIGYLMSAVIEIVLKKSGFDEAADKIANYPNVCALYDVTGNTDVMVIAKFKSGSNLTNFIKEIEKIDSVDTIITHVVLNNIKEDFGMI